MEIFGIGLHIIIAIFFAIHVVRNGRSLFWLLILFSFPLLGSVVYFVVEYLPELKGNRGINKAASIAGNLLDPEKEVRAARNALDLSPSAQNQLRLAKALMARGETREAVKYFDACLAGPFGKEPEVRLSAAMAKLQNSEAQQALELAQALRANCPDYLLEKAMLLLAQAFAATGDEASARQEFSAAVTHFGSIDARGQYAVWSAEVGDLDTAEKLYYELAQSEKHWTTHSRSLNKPLMQKVETSITTRKRTGARS